MRRLRRDLGLAFAMLIVSVPNRGVLPRIESDYAAFVFLSPSRSALAVRFKSDKATPSSDIRQCLEIRGVEINSPTGRRNRSAGLTMAAGLWLIAADIQGFGDHVPPGIRRHPPVREDSRTGAFVV